MKPAMFICCVLLVLFTSGERSNRLMSAPIFQVNQTGEQFTAIRRGDGRASDRTFLELATYLSSKGGEATVVRGTFATPTAAREELEARIRTAKKVLSRTPTRDAKGEMVGERAMYLFKPENVDVTVVVWTRGTEFYSVSSDSQALCLRLEQKLNTMPERKTGARSGCQVPLACD